MAIRLRVVKGFTVALCAARSVEQEGDIYLDDAAHHALATKFALDFADLAGNKLPHDNQLIPLMEQEESNNPNREWWDKEYGTT